MKSNPARAYHLLLRQIVIIVLLSHGLFAQSTDHHQAEWKKKYNYSQTREQFREPPMFYAPHAFWFWDTAIDTVQIAAMAENMTKQGLNPGYAHPRHSEAPASAFPALPKEEWLSPLWFRGIETAAKKAQRAGMTFGYCDEYWWPSGRADGRVLQQAPELEATSLTWKRMKVKGGERVSLPASKVTVAARLAGDSLLASNTLTIIGEGAPFEWEVPDGEWVIYSYNIWKSDLESKVNYLDPKLMDVFIPIAHESYAKNVGKFMGNVIPGVFVDNEGDYGFKMAWSEYLPQRYRELKGKAMLLYLPLLTEKDEEGYWVTARYDWFDVVSDIYTNHFIGRVNDWLAERDMYYISNLWEESLLLQARAVGDFMRAQRRVTMPGNDCLLMYSQNVHDFKETQSVCAFEDRPFMSELMGVAGWQMTPAQMKMTLNAVTAWGVTHTVPHGIYLNRRLETIPYPPDWYEENPWWRYLHLWTDFARRASFVNRQGKPEADILLFNPLESIWALSEGYFTSPAGDEWPQQAVEINNVYSEAMKTLTDAWFDYLIADKYYLDRAEIVHSENTVKLKINGYEFSVLVLPPLFVLSRETSGKIVDFARAGGHVVLLGELAVASPQKGLDDPVIISNMKKLRQLPSAMDLSDEKDKMSMLPRKIKEILDPQIIMKKGDLPLKISHRRIDGRDFYWLANNSGRPQHVALSLRDGGGAVEVWDCETGEIRPVAYHRDHGRNEIELSFDEYEGFWLVFDPSAKAEKIAPAPHVVMDEITLRDEWLVSYPETDTVWLTSAKSLVADNPQVHREYFDPAYDDSSWPYVNIVGDIRLEGQWKTAMFYNPDPDSKRYYRHKFDLEDEPAKAVININGDNAIGVWVNGKPVTPGKNAESWAVFDAHEIEALLRKGSNVIAVEERNRAGYGWAVLQGLILLKNGHEKEILFDNSWKESKTHYPGWQSVDFDDSSWKKPVEADELTASFNFKRMRPPHKIIFSKSTVWWRIKVIPNADYLAVPGIDKSAQMWIDGKKINVTDDRIDIPQGAKLITIKNGEDASGLTRPAVFHCSGKSKTALVSWPDMGLRRFTGFVDYETVFNLPDDVSSVIIDLGNVRYMAEVRLNGEKIGERLWPPFVFEAGKVKKGENRIRIRVGNLMVNRMGGEDDLGRLRTWGWQTPPDSSFIGGLFGPVKIKTIAK